MLQLVNVGHKSLADYATIATRGLMDEIRVLAEPLAGARVLELSATAFGGGVAEIQYTLVPLMQDAGLNVEWRIIKGADEFFSATKTIHNALQGSPQGLTGEQRECFARFQELNAREIDVDAYDFIVVHDPQPIGVIDHLGGGSAKWAWRGHIDFSTPNEDVLDFLLPSIRRYDAAIFHLAEYVPHRDGLPPCVIWPPAIDPLAPKNMALSPEDAAYIVDQFGIDVSRPLIAQISRFDPWKDPLGVIDAYRLVKAEHPQLQLALVGSMAHDDPEGWEYWHQTVAYADADPDIFILSNLNNVGSVEVNAFQVHSRAVIQKSIREGFGLTVSEAPSDVSVRLVVCEGYTADALVAYADRNDDLLVLGTSRRRRLFWGEMTMRRCVQRGPGGSRGGARARARRQGTRQEALPHAAAASRPARALQPARRP